MVVDVEPSQAEIDRIFHALADATRRDILARVIEREQSVSALARSYAMSLPAVQKHVGVLEAAGLVGKRRSGREQRVHAEPERIRIARELLDRFEVLWRARIATMARLLAEDPTARRE
ncbi:MAG: winged helix-turn-helix transcriptional regulator [Acidobacteria bacterium]|nr:winged helix-turn-helix transcriptional regulator [Acidobacteriota bacterium]